MFALRNALDVVKEILISCATGLVDVAINWFALALEIREQQASVFILRERYVFPRTSTHIDVPGSEPIPYRGSGALILQQTRRGPFSAVSKPIFESKYTLVTRCYAKQYEVLLRCMSPCSVCIKDFFPLKILRISSHRKY